MAKTLTQMIVQHLLEDLSEDKHFSDRLMYMEGQERQALTDRWLQLVRRTIEVSGNVPE
jgi:hypothetical protein